MAAPPGVMPVPAYRRPSTAQTAWPWPEADTAAVAYRCLALGSTEVTTIEFLHSCRTRGIRRLKPYVDGIADADLEQYLEAAHSVFETYRATRRRGDIVRLRGIKRWPWRTRSDQHHAGVVGDVI